MDFIALISDWSKVLITGLASGAMFVWANTRQRFRDLEAQTEKLSDHTTKRLDGLDRELDDRFVEQGKRLGALEVHDNREVQALNQRIIRVEERISGLPSAQLISQQSERLCRIEEIITRVPSHEHLTAIYEAINPLRESLATVRADLNSQTDSLRSIRVGLDRLTNTVISRLPAHGHNGHESGSGPHE